MKITKEHYQTVKDAMTQKLKSTSKEDIKQYIENMKNDHRVKDINKCMRWDLFYAAGMIRYTTDTLYAYMNDDHIETALIKIQKEIGFMA